MENQQVPLRVRTTAKRQVSLNTFIAVVLLVLVVGFVSGTRSQGLISAFNRTFGTTIEYGADIDLSYAQEAYRMINDHYDGEIDTSTLADGAAHGLAESLGDPYTVYMNADEAAEYQKELSGSLSGIGAEIGVRNDKPTILRIIDDSPAKISGLSRGDVIDAIDDKSTEGFDAYDAAQRIRGDAGTEVVLTIDRGGQQKEFTITRAEVTDPSVSSSIRGSTGIITIRRFDTDTGQQTRMAARKLLTDGATNFVLDLRDNGGGYLNQAQSVAGLWLTDKLVVSERHGNIRTEKLYTTGEAVLEGRPTVVLINSSTASASEIVAGALKDHQVATLIGEKSYGKGVVQQIFNLSEGRQIKITIARWMTPNGDSIDKQGIKPDVDVELSSSEINKGVDTQLDAALKKLQ